MGTPLQVVFYNQSGCKVVTLSVTHREADEDFGVMSRIVPQNAVNSSRFHFYLWNRLFNYWEGIDRDHLLITKLDHSEIIKLCKFYNKVSHTHTNGTQHAPAAPPLVRRSLTSVLVRKMLRRVAWRSHFNSAPNWDTIDHRALLRHYHPQNTTHQALLLPRKVSLLDY